MRAMGHVWSRKGDMEKARFWYAQSAERGDPIAMFHLAWTHDQAVLDDADTRYLRMAAREEAIERGEAPPVRPASDKINIDTAKKWYQKSADLGFAPALNNLGKLYMYGVVERPDQPRGFDLLMRAARKGNPVARWNVSMSYLSGMGVDMDLAEAAEWRTWTRSDAIKPDLDQPTFSRTKLMGGNLPEWERNNILVTSEYLAPTAENTRPARAHPEVLTTNELVEKLANQPPSPFHKPMKADPRIPTFRDVANKLPNQSTSWNKRRMKADPGTPTFGEATKELPKQRTPREKRRMKVDRPLPDLR